MRRLPIIGALLIVAGAFISSTAGAAQGGTDHPECEGRIEVSVNAATYTVPAGNWASVWTKSGNNPHISQSTVPGTVLTSQEFNQNNVEQNISHVDLCPGGPTETTEPETTTTTVVETTTTVTETTQPTEPIDPVTTTTQPASSIDTTTTVALIVAHTDLPATGTTSNMLMIVGGICLTVGFILRRAARTPS